MEVGDEVMFVKELKSLVYGTVGVLSSIHLDTIKGDWGVVVYKDYVKNKTGVYCHSAKLCDLKLM